MDPTLRHLIAELRKILVVAKPRIFELPDKDPGQGVCVAMTVMIEEAIQDAIDGADVRAREQRQKGTH